MIRNDLPSGTYGLSKARERVIQALEQAFATQHLESDDYEARLALAYDATNLSELRKAVHDFPNVAQLVSHPAMDSPAKPARKQTFFALVGDKKMDGHELDGEGLTAYTLIGDVMLDFTQMPADQEAKVVLEHYSMIGDTTLVVPAGTRIIRQYFSLIGDYKRVAAAPDAGSTHGLTILLKGVKIIGDVKIIYR